MKLEKKYKVYILYLLILLSVIIHIGMIIHEATRIRSSWTYDEIELSEYKEKKFKVLTSDKLSDKFKVKAEKGTKVSNRVIFTYAYINLGVRSHGDITIKGVYERDDHILIWVHENETKEKPEEHVKTIGVRMGYTKKDIVIKKTYQAYEKEAE